MNEFLKRLKLIDELTLTLPVTRNDFINRLKDVTGEGNAGMPVAFEVFSSSTKEFKG